VRAPALSPERIAAIHGARLDTAAGVRVLCDAAKDLAVWNAYVHPDVQNALFHVEVRANIIGMPRDVLLGEIEHYLIQAEAGRSPVTPVLEFIKGELDVLVERHRDAQISATAVEAQRPAIERLAIKKRKPAIEAAAIKRERPAIEAEAARATKHAATSPARAARQGAAADRVRGWIKIINADVAAGGSVGAAIIKIAEGEVPVLEPETVSRKIRQHRKKITRTL
jgi:hypothetical protein